jgi:hypothetical protein
MLFLVCLVLILEISYLISLIIQVEGFLLAATVCMIFLKLKLNYDRQSVGESVLVLGTHLGPATNFSFSLKFSLDSCGFVIL